ncbi:hypothetical protein TNCV_3763441 [Trichonephila clavipes]|uniref:Uncharacterized protein n=1 Tax=Trichonephila clavipes TaxID=2585209 RepID=A0A8X7B9J5_TRICX|nr:hypothetical protein TNCV_3763441 [Trichonephila clavipes]
MVLKANDRRTSCPCHDEFRGPGSDYVRQVASENINNNKMLTVLAYCESLINARQLTYVTESEAIKPISSSMFQDGEVRLVRVQTSTNELLHLIQRIYPLEIATSDGPQYLKSIKSIDHYEKSDQLNDTSILEHTPKFNAGRAATRDPSNSSLGRVIQFNGATRLFEVASLTEIPFLDFVLKYMAALNAFLLASQKLCNSTSSSSKVES